MPTPSDLQLGRLAVQRGLTTEERVRECLELQRRNRAIGYDEPLSALLVKRGFIGEADRRALEDDLARVLFVRGEQLFARRCVERGLVERDEARALLHELRADGFRARLGELLVERGKLDRVQRDAIAREVVRLQDEEERAALDADGVRPGERSEAGQADGGAPAATPEPDDEAGSAAPAVQARALASYDRDQRRFSSSGEWVDGALPKLDGFELERRLGQGPNGVVYRAKTDAGERVALKVLAPGLVGSPGFLAGIKRAWALAQRVEHPTFVRLGAPGRQGDLVYFTMDLVDGESLQASIDRSGPLPGERVVALLRSILQGLERAQQVGVAHGALCPENVLIARATGWPVVTDLPLSGVGRVTEGAAALYASPQRLAGAAPLPTVADDVYSLACLAYFAVVGRPPFPDASPTARLLTGAPDPRDADPSIDPRIAAFVERGTRPEPAERLDLAQALAVVETGRARAPQPPQPPQPPRAPAPLPPRAPAPPPPPPPPVPPASPAPPRGRPQVPAPPSLASVADEDDAPDDNDRTLAMPAVLPLPPAPPPPAPPPLARPALADDDLDAVERTMEVAPPVGARLEDAPIERTILLPPGAAAPAGAFPDDAPIERTMLLSPPTTPPPAEEEEPGIDRTITLPPPGGDDGIERTLAVGPPAGWSELLRKDPVADSHTATQPMTPLPRPGLASTLPDAPSLPAATSVTEGSGVARSTRSTGVRPVASGFDAMGETMPMKPLGAPDDLVGRLVHNRYRIVSKLGQGGMGVVYRAEHTLMGRAVAFKVLSPELVKNAESIARFKREVMAMAQFQHRNVVRIFDAGATEDGRFYMAMELVDGRSLADVLHEGPLPPERVVRILAQVLRGVAEGHKRGIVHRDLKSENILLTVENGEEVVKIMDFGIAKVLWERESPQSQSNAFLTTERMAVGTPEYMSPEQASGGARIDARSDIYSLGVVAYEMLTGRLPFDADSPVGFIGKHIIDPPIPFAERAPQLALSAAAEQLVMKALEKDPESRFPSAEAMLVALEQAFPEYAAALRVGQAERSASRSAAPPPLTPTGSAVARDRTSPPPWVKSSAPPPSEEASGELSGEALDAPAPGSKLVVRLLMALGGVAVLLLATIVVLIVARRPSSGGGESGSNGSGSGSNGGGGGAAVAALGPALGAKVKAALGARQFAEARQLVSGARPADAADPRAAEVDATLARIDEVEATITRLDAVSGQLAAAVDELRRASGAEELAAAEAALARLRPLPEEAARLHARLLELDAAALAGTVAPTADVAELEADQVKPLRELEDAATMASKLLAATPPDYDAALARCESALARTKLPARREQLQSLRREARAGQLVAQARRELERTPPDHARALDLLQQAYAEVPTDATRELLDRTRQRAAESQRDAASRELGERVRAAEAALAADPEAAVRELQRAARLVKEQGLQDTYDLPRRLAAAEAAQASRAAHAALPAVPAEGAAAAEVEHALTTRRRYLEEHPAGFKRAEVEAEAAALEPRLAALREGSTAGTIERLLADARAAMGRRAWDDARALAQEAVDAARGASIDPAPARELLTKIDEREALHRSLEADFVQVGPLRVARYEVTSSEYFAFCVRRITQARAARDDAALERARALWPDGWVASRHDPDMRQFPSGTGQQPVGGVSFRDAEAYCAWRTEELGVTVRLPTEAEWVEAAGGKDGRAYPWGATFDPARAAYRRMSEGPVPVTAELQGQSPFDVRHMAGNVAEWVDTVFEDPTDGPDPSSRLLKGGSYRSLAPENLRLDARLRGGITERKPEWGFRVVVAMD